jgi:hypothetical protein
MEEFFVVIVRSQQCPYTMDEWRTFKDMQELSERSDSKYSQKFYRSNDQIYESICAWFLRTPIVWRMVEKTEWFSIRQNQRRVYSQTKYKWIMINFKPINLSLFTLFTLFNYLTISKDINWFY